MILNQLALKKIIEHMVILLKSNEVKIIYNGEKIAVNKILYSLKINKDS